MNCILLLNTKEEEMGPNYLVKPFSSKYLLLCSAEEINAYRLGTT